MPYKAEAAPHLDMFGGVLDAGWANPATARGHLHAGKMKVMGITEASQGTIAWHSDAHLATSDRGVIMLRKLLRRQLDAIHDGQDPADVIRDPAAPPVRFDAGNYLLQP